MLSNPKREELKKKFVQEIEPKPRYGGESNGVQAILYDTPTHTPESIADYWLTVLDEELENQRQVYVESIKGLRRDCHEIDEETGQSIKIDDYGYGATHNRALDEAINIINNQ